MTTPYVGQISMTGFNFAPPGWALCNGQTLPISQYQALFAIIGTTYGGDGITNFQLPNLQGRVGMHMGTSPGTGNFVLGQIGGETTHTLTQAEMPAHYHPAVVASAGGNSAVPTNNAWAASTDGDPIYINPSKANTTLAINAIGTTGGNQPHENMQPFLAINFIIALQGIFPTHN
jgi:microcystin-dependent protein